MLGLTSRSAAYEYIDQVVDKFNLYVESEILPKLNADELTPAQVLTGLQFILVNNLPDYEYVVLELLAMRHASDQARHIYESALRVGEFYGIAPCRVVRALVESMLALDHSQRDRVYKSVVLEMGKEAALVMLDMLEPHRKANTRKELVVLIQQASGVKAPQPWPKWVHTGDAALTGMKQVWEGLIDPEETIRAALDDPANPCGGRAHDEQSDQLAKLMPIDLDNDGFPGDNERPTEEIGRDAEDGGENRERVDKPKAGGLPRDGQEELEELRPGSSRGMQTPGPSAPPKPIPQPKLTKRQLLDWSTYTAPAWVLLGGIAVTLIGMISVIAGYRRARRRRIQNWNRWSGT